MAIFRRCLDEKWDSICSGNGKTCQSIGFSDNETCLTQQEIRLTGIDILGRHMGLTGMIRFLQQAETGYGDYTKDRDRLLGDPSLEELVSDIQSGGFNEKSYFCGSASV